MKNVALLLVACLLINCSKGTPKEKKWTVFNTKDSIPEKLNLKLIEFYGNFEIADFNQRFNSSDFLFDSLPTRRITMLARKDYHWRMTYVQGGFAKYYVIIDCHIKGDSISEFRTAETRININNNDSIDVLIKNKELRFN